MRPADCQQQPFHRHGWHGLYRLSDGSGSAKSTLHEWSLRPTLHIRRSAAKLRQHVLLLAFPAGVVTSGAEHSFRGDKRAEYGGSVGGQPLLFLQHLRAVPNGVQR